MIYLILLFGLVFRLVSLNQSLWLDEATTALVARMSVADIFNKFLPGDFHPPFYYLIVKYWTALFGNSEISLRMPSVILGVLTIYLIYLIARKVFSRNTGLIASALMTTSGLAIYYSQEARMYCLAAFLVSLSVYLFLTKKWLLLSIILALIGMTDYVSLFIIPAFLVVGWKDIKKVALGFIPLFITFLLWFPTFIKQLSGGLSIRESEWWNILGQPTLKNALLIPIKFILGRISFDNKLIYGTTAGVAFALFGYVLLKARRADKVLWLWLILPTALGILVSLRIPTLSYFRFLFCLPAFYILVAAGLEKTGKYKRVALALILLINILSAGYYLLNPRFHREDWRAAAKAIGSNKIVFPANSQKEALIYYGKGGQIVNASSLEPSDAEVWLSRYVWEIVDPEDSTRHKIESLGYNMATENNFNGVVLFRYTKNQYAHSN